MTTYFVLSSKAFCMKRSDKSYSPTACKIKPMLLYKIKSVPKNYLKKKQKNKKTQKLLDLFTDYRIIQLDSLIFRQDITYIKQSDFWVVFSMTQQCQIPRTVHQSKSIRHLIVCKTIKSKMCLQKKSNLHQFILSNYVQENRMPFY